ncbi:unnamed protein product [Rotaria sordida]|uniref:Uncharacterized protein n=1 Tax=Rotaria sordida TaxID=392033 RepID=A0A815L2G4_9BILA|nr:unnamed protein product [Rotaria sordida]CAF1404277.1 unnamed protein product [Rotaria sordida]CAF3740779.1 unnamed protein product [Rotaria sordida]CAF3769897.1 unnamed protein product [Rotaria sordida]
MSLPLDCLELAANHYNLAKTYEYHNRYKEAIDHIYTVICISLVHQNHRESWFYGFIRLFITSTSIRANSTAQTTYLAKTIVLVNDFQANLAYNCVLEIESTNLVSYLKNSTN